MIEIINVGIAEIKLTRPPARLRTTGLGSCVGIVLFDCRINIAGLAHVMLPDSSLAKDKELNHGKYGDTAPIALFNQLCESGANPKNIKAKIAGGAQMFQFAGSNQMMRIGPRNIEAVKQSLNQLRIHIVSEDVGGNSGRTIEFNIESRELMIKTVYKGVTII
jgi:chemotaxis protein CheD